MSEIRRKENKSIIREAAGRIVLVTTVFSIYIFVDGAQEIIWTLAMYFIFIEFIKYLERTYRRGYVPGRFKMLNDAVLWFWRGFR